MLDGITILNEEVCNTGATFTHIFFGILSIFMILFTIIVVIISIKGRYFSEAISFAAILLIPISLLFIWLTLLTANYSKNEYTKYEVIISDNVSLKEFNDKYSIIEQHGDIYVIKEKEK